MPANDKRVVKVNRRSGYDKHYRNTLTGNVGTLVPILVDELCPDSKVNLKINVAACLPPLVSDTYMNVRLRVEAFAVPHRLCQQNYEEFFSDFAAKYIESFDAEDDAPVDAPFTFSDDKNACMALIRFNGGAAYDYSTIRAKIGPGSLADYMGIPQEVSYSDSELNFDVVVSPLVAYHLIWECWYRNPRVQKPAFSPLDSRTKMSSNIVEGDSYPYDLAIAASLPYTRFYFSDAGVQPVVRKYPEHDVDVPEGAYMLADGKHILDLRQRNFGLDFFTAAMVEPQQGPAAVVKFGENGDPADGFSIASLRAQNSLQQFRERNNLTSPRYQQQIYARYGCAPSDGIIQRPVLIGAATYDVYSHGVTANAPTAEGIGVGPFGDALGNRAGNGFASGSDFIISGFHTKEPMYLIVLASLVPEVSYSQNMNMIFNRYKGLGSITDLANPILQNVGPQPIPIKSLYANPVSPDDVFAYTDRYSDWMFKNNEIHGHFKYGQDLAPFVAQRYFASEPEFGSEFLTIPTDYLDDVMQFTSATLGFGYWMDCLLEYKVSMPLQEYAIPSLQDPGYEHGKTIVLRKNGQLL